LKGELFLVKWFGGKSGFVIFQRNLI
jgi:hypothetical protein